MIKRYSHSHHQRSVRVRHKLKAVASRPRLTVFRSNLHIYAQVVDDTTGQTLASASDISLKGKHTKIEKATTVGATLAKAATQAKVTKVYFDRGHYKFHGRVKALAEAARQNGLEF